MYSPKRTKKLLESSAVRSEKKKTWLFKKDNTVSLLHCVGKSGFFLRTAAVKSSMAVLEDVSWATAKKERTANVLNTRLNSTLRIQEKYFFPYKGHKLIIGK